MITLQQVELGVLGPLQVRQYGLPVAIPGAKPRAILTMLGLHGGSVVSADTLVELLWGDDPPRTAAKALQTHISSLRRTLGDGFVLTQGTGWTLSTTEIDATRYKVAARLGREAITTGDAAHAVARFDEALTLWRGIPELPDGPRGTSEKTRWTEGHAALVEDRADALLATGRAAEIVGELEAAVADAPLRERRWGHLMLALYRAGRQGEALGAYQRVRSLLADQLGVDPGPDLRRLEAAIVTQDAALEMPVSQQLQSVTRAVTFLLTDIEGSTAAWEADADAMAVALARHDEIVEQVVTSRGGRLIKTRGEGDATFSVFDRPSAAAAGAIELQEAIFHEPWALAEPIRIRVALHTGEVELRDGDYFGRAVNRAARLRSLAAGGQILCSGATAELVIDTLPDDVVLADLGMRQLKNLPRPEHVFELRLENADDFRAPATDVPIERPALPAALAGPGPFVGRGPELERLLSAWQTTLDVGTGAVLIAGEPGVGKTRLAGEWSHHAYEQGAVVLYGRCDEDLGAPYQPFAEALRSLVPCLGTKRLRGLRGVEALLPLVPGLADALPDLAAPTRADPDTERYALFDAVVAMLGVASASAPVVLILDDLHWAAKPTLLLLRHLLRFGERARVQIVGTYRSTDLDRSHPLAAMLADLHRDGSASRLALSGLDEGDVTAYVAEAGYDDEELARALATVTGGNPFFLIEALRHVDESGGRWDPSTLPQGVREAVSRRLSRLPAETNKALAAAAVVGSHFALALVESVVGEDLIDAFDEASKAGIVIEEPGGRYRFNHAIVRQSLLAELASVRRMRLHQKIAATLETEPGADDELLAELAYHYFECAWAGNAAKAVEYCRRAADQAMARLAYEGAADLYDRAWHALEEIDDELPDRDEQQAELLVARCEALLAAGDVVSATGAVSQLQEAAGDSGRLAAWGTCFDGQLSMLTHPERLDEIESAVRAAAEKLAELDDAAGEAKAHTVRAGCLGRLGRIGDCETALDQALTAARRAREHRRVNAVLAQAPLAALWGPNPVPRAGGRCLDVVRLLRITTGSPVVEATSTRCQGVLDAFRGRAAAGRQLIESARRTLTDLGMRHARLEVDQFAGIVELVADDPAAAEQHLRRAYNGFRRMGLDADTAETAALLARACLALARDDEADELCTESEHLAGHALKPSIAWRTVRAELSARRGAHDEARRVAEEAVAVAGRTDALVDHGDACLALATVLDTAGDAAGARAAAGKALELYELKGAAALAEKARSLLGKREPTAPAPAEASSVEPENACVRAGDRLIDAVNREAWDEVVPLLAPYVSVESHRKIVGFPRIDLQSSRWPQDMRRFLATGMVRYRHAAVAVRGERLALTRLELGTADLSSGAPQDEMLHIAGLDHEGRIALQVWFDVEDIDAAMAELDAACTRFEDQHPLRAPLENAASRAEHHLNALFADRCWDKIAARLVDDIQVEERRRGFRRESDDRAKLMAEVRVVADLGVKNITSTPVAVRGEHLVLSLARFSGRTQRPDKFQTEVLRLAEIDNDERFVAFITFDTDNIDAAFEELDARYLAGEAASHAHIWALIARARAMLMRRELPPTTPDWVNLDHRRGIGFAPGDMTKVFRDRWDHEQEVSNYIENVHRLNELGAVFTQVARATTEKDFEAEWRVVELMTVQGDLINRAELFDEADLDAALAKFNQLNRSASQLENAASRVYERLQRCFSVRDWDGMAEAMAIDVYQGDRRRVVNAEARKGREAAVAEGRAVADLGARLAALTVIAVRGQRLALVRIRFSGRDQRPEAFHTEALCVVEIDFDERVATHIMFDPDGFDPAFKELDARYLAGEAAPYARVWQNAMDTLGEANRHEPGPTMRGLHYVDHRRVSFGSGNFGRAVEELWALVPDARYRVTAVHALDAHGTVASLVIEGTDSHGNELEWSRVVSLLPDEPRMDVYDDDDIDAALARFEELRTQARKLENTASQVAERFLELFAAGDWDAIAEILADDFFSEDRRPVVGAGIRHGRDVEIASIRAGADLGGTNMTSPVIATRGSRLILTRTRHSGRDQAPDAFRVDALAIVEIDADNRIAARILFDPEDIDAAFAELDARHLAGEAAPYAHTWSVITGSFAAVNRHELPELTPDWVNVDHRRAASFAPGEMAAYTHATWEQLPDVTVYVEAVHRLTNLGAVVTQAASGTSQEGFHAEWHEIGFYTVQGDRLSGSELFDETDLDAALARFDELSRPARRLESAATRAYERLHAQFAARDWDAITEILADDYYQHDRRPVVGGEIRRGRNALMEDLRAAADLGITDAASDVIATRGERLTLTRVRYSRSHEEPEAYYADLLQIIEIDADERIAALVAFDIDDIDAAVEDLDARYLAGEAAANAHTWSVIVQAYASLNRQEIPPTTLDWVNLDHRRVTAFVPGDQIAYLRATWDIAPVFRIYIEAVHRLTDLGAVVTNSVRGTTQEGFEAEWREVTTMTVEGDKFDRSELFDEVDIDAALARFDELTGPARRLENAASRTFDRFNAYLAARDWDAMAELIADDACNDDRRRVVNGGIQRGRDAQIANLRAVIDVGVRKMESVVIATRGERIALARTRVSGGDERPEAFGVELLNIVEIDTDNRIAAGFVFDLEDIKAAFEELDARYLAGEAADHADTWSVVARHHAAFNRRELPTKAPELVDHRPLVTLEPGDPIANIREMWDFTPDLRLYVEAVHRLSDLGAVFTQVSHGTLQAGFDAEWRIVELVTVDGDLVKRAELFEEGDIDAALARFDELSRPTLRLENAASKVNERFFAHFAARDWDALAETVAEDISNDDRRPIVGAGVQRGRDAQIADARAIAGIGITKVASTVIATRGRRLILTRTRFSGPETFPNEVLGVIEINDDNQMSAVVVFGLDDIDAAFAELDARYLAGEAADHTRAWSAIVNANIAFNRHEAARTTSDWVYVDHQRIARIEVTGSEVPAYLETVWRLTPELNLCLEAVHRLSDVGAVVTQTARGTSSQGFDAEWRLVEIMTIEGDLISRSEIFDEADLDAALARFDELSPAAPRLENAASRVGARFSAYMAAPDWAAMAEMVAEDMCNDDRRPVVNAGLRRGRDAEIANVRTLVDLGVKNATPVVIATRGERLALGRIRLSGRDQRPEAFHTEVLGLIEIDAENRISARVWFELDDIDAAFEELDRRYLAGEAADHTDTWSAIVGSYAALNRHEQPPTTPNWRIIDHRPGTRFESGDHPTILGASWDVTPDLNIRIDAVHRLSNVGAVVTHTGYGTSHEGFQAEWRNIVILAVEGDLPSRCELFDEADIDAALARFDDLSAQAPQLENAATRTWARLTDAFNRRDLDDFVALTSPDGHFEDRRKGLRDSQDASMRRRVAQALFDLPPSWRLEIEPVAIRGSRRCLIRQVIRETDQADRPITIELLTVLEVGNDGLAHTLVNFDPDDINGAIGELTARWIASGEVAHPHAIEAVCRLSETVNHHDWDAFATLSAGATYVNHRQLSSPGIETIADHMPSIRTMASLVPDYWVELAEVLTHSPTGVVGDVVLRGTSTDGLAIEIPLVMVVVVDRDRVTGFEAFDSDQRDLALARFDELNQPT